MPLACVWQVKAAQDKGYDMPSMFGQGVEKLGMGAAKKVHVDVLCHTGGPRVLKEVAKSIDADETRLAASWAVMKAHGNLSGASNLAVLHEHNKNCKAETDWCLCLSMGPGVCLEGVVLRRVGVRVPSVDATELHSCNKKL